MLFTRSIPTTSRRCEPAPRTSILPECGQHVPAGHRSQRGLQGRSLEHLRQLHLRRCHVQKFADFKSPNNPFADPNGNIFVVPGDHLTGIPNYRFKLGGQYKITDPWKVGAELNVIVSQWLVGDEANQNPKVPAYWVVNLNSSYKITQNLEVFGLVRNLFNKHYFTGGTFFETDYFPI